MQTENISNDIALILTVDSNKKVLVEGRLIDRYFEEEIIRNVKSWRKNGGWLCNVKIYALHSNGSQIKEHTIKELRGLGVEYVDDYNEKSKNHVTGFLDEPYCGKYFESINPIKERILIKTDLDMQLIHPMEQNLIERAYGNTIIGQYDIQSAKCQRRQFNGHLPFDTNLIITDRIVGFYEEYYDMCFSEEILENYHYKSIQKEYGDYYLEEFVVDYINHRNTRNITPITYYQYGEGYPKISTYPIERIKDVMFLHEHIYKNGMFPFDYNPTMERLDYLKMLKRV